LQQITIGGGTIIFSNGRILLCKLLIEIKIQKPSHLFEAAFFYLSKTEKMNEIQEWIKKTIFRWQNQDCQKKKLKLK